MAAAASSAGKKARECRVCADFSSWSKAQAAREEVVKCACVCTRVCARNRVYPYAYTMNVPLPCIF